MKNGKLISQFRDEELSVAKSCYIAAGKFNWSSKPVEDENCMTSRVGDETGVIEPSGEIATIPTRYSASDINGTHQSLL